MATPDENLWHAERRLWTDGGDAYPALVSPDALMTLPGIGVMTGAEAIAAMEGNAGWRSVEMSSQRIFRSGKSIAVLAYRGDGVRPDGSAHSAWCASTYHADGGDWLLIQHSQTVID